MQCSAQLGAGIVVAMMAGGCAGAATAGTAAWVRDDGQAIADGRMVVVPVTRAVGSTLGGSETLSVGGGRSAFLTFDLALLPDAAIDRAFLALAPHASWRVQPRSTRIFVHAITSPWSARSVAQSAPTLASDPVAAVDLSLATRAPVRIDVTAALRQWRSRGIAFYGLALATTDDVVVFAGPDAERLIDRPQLEVVMQ